MCNSNIERKTLDTKNAFKFTRQDALGKAHRKIPNKYQ